MARLFYTSEEAQIIRQKEAQKNPMRSRSESAESASTRLLEFDDASAFIFEHPLLQDHQEIAFTLVGQIQDLMALKQNRFDDFLAKHRGEPIEKIAKVLQRRTNLGEKGIKKIQLDEVILELAKKAGIDQNAVKVVAAKNAIASSGRPAITDTTKGFSADDLDVKPRFGTKPAELINLIPKEQPKKGFWRKLGMVLGLTAAATGAGVGIGHMVKGPDSQSPDNAQTYKMPASTPDKEAANARTTEFESLAKQAAQNPEKIIELVNTMPEHDDETGSIAKAGEKVEKDTTSPEMTRTDIISYPISEGGSFSDILKQIDKKNNTNKYAENYTRLANGKIEIINHTGQNRPWGQVPGFLLHAGDVVTPSFDSGELSGFEVTHPVGEKAVEKAGGTTPRTKDLLKKKVSESSHRGGAEMGGDEEEAGGITIRDTDTQIPSSLRERLAKESGGMAGWKSDGTGKVVDEIADDTLGANEKRHGTASDTFKPEEGDLGIGRASDEANITGISLKDKLKLKTTPNEDVTPPDFVPAMNESDYIRSQQKRALSEHQADISGRVNANSRGEIMKDWAFINDITKLTSDAAIKTGSQTENERRQKAVKKLIEKLSPSDWQRLAGTVVKQLENMGSGVGVEANTFMTSFNPDNLSAHNIDQYRQASREHLLTFEKYLLRDLGLDYSLLLKSNKQKMVKEAIEGGEYYKKVWLPIVEFKNKILVMQYGKADNRTADYHLDQQVALSEEKAKATLDEIYSELRKIRSYNRTLRVIEKNKEGLESEASDGGLFSTEDNITKAQQVEEAKLRAGLLWKDLDTMARNYNRKHNIKGGSWDGIKDTPEYLEYLKESYTVLHADDQMTASNDLERDFMRAGVAGETTGDKSTADATRNFGSADIMKGNESTVAVNGILMDIKRALRTISAKGIEKFSPAESDFLASNIQKALDEGKIGPAGAKKIMETLQRDRDLLKRPAILSQFERAMKLAALLPNKNHDDDSGFELTEDDDKESHDLSEKLRADWNKDKNPLLKGESPKTVNRILIETMRVLREIDAKGEIESVPETMISELATSIKEAIDSGEIGSAGAMKIKKKLQEGKNGELSHLQPISEIINLLSKLSPEEKPVNYDDDLDSASASR